MNQLLSQHQNTLMSAMPWVLNYKNKLEKLNEWWNKVSLIGKINSYNIETMIFSDMNSTKSKLGELQQELTKNLLAEEVKKAVLDSEAKAQVAIDILVRNLFERTADVGFLATDTDIITFLQQDNITESDIERLRERLEEYVKKYSVYYDIVVTDTQGQVKVKLDAENPVQSSSDSLIPETLKSSEEYVETYRYTDLRADRENSLVYSCKILPNNTDAQPIGVLCLFFKFEDEMQGIFERLADSDEKGILMLTDAKGQVLSSNCLQVAQTQSFRPHQKPMLIPVNQQTYLSTSVETKGYQGFFGLGWYGNYIIPVKDAFSPSITESNDTNFDDSNMLTTSSLFSDELKLVHKHSQDINSDLKLIVLNGIIISARSKALEIVPVLEEIKVIGDNTESIFSESIQRLQDTVLSSRLSNAEFNAELAVDIMDRNLYERANDCRWWALTGLFRELLAKASLTDEEQDELCAVLRYINDLYTVYTNLYLYDKNRKIVAVSNKNEQHLIGSYVSEDSGVKEALKITDSQKYAVSPFVDTTYYNNRPTYIYNASVTKLENSHEVVGGIGIVFDSEPQFKDMLTDTLPKDESGNVVDGCFALYTDREGTVISSTDYSPVAINERLDLDREFFSLENGKSLAKVITYKDFTYVVGAATSEGYREYKTTGDYNNDVIALLFLPM